MYIQLTTITQAKQLRDFRLYTHELELAFELVDIATQCGETVTSISYFDQKGELPLPIEAINSSSPINSFLQLKQQWEFILSPLAGTESGKVKPNNRRNEYLTITKQNQLRHFQQVRNRMQQLLETTKTKLTDGPRKKRLLDIHRKSIQRCQQAIAILEASS